MQALRNSAIWKMLLIVRFSLMVDKMQMKRKLTELTVLHANLGVLLKYMENVTELASVVGCVSI